MTRYLAVSILTSLLTHHGSLSTLVPPAASRLSARDKGLLMQLCYGVTRDFFRLQTIANTLLKRPMQDKDQDLLAVILLGIYQLRDTRIPAHAAIGETVAVADDLSKPWAKGLINAVLRRYQREREEIDASLSDDEQYLWNHPDWMLAKLRNNWPDHWQSILSGNDVKGPLCLRVNKRSLTRDELINEFRIFDIDATPGLISSQAIYLQQAQDVQELPGFDEGWFSVQDEAAQLAAELLELEPGQHLLDACAAPGGKLCHLIEQAEDPASITAIEISESRAERIHDNLHRLGFEDACNLLVADASDTDWWNGQLYDRILIDAPCSGTGVIRRHPDIKLLRRNEDLKLLADLQLRILNNLWPMLKPGGRLVYATCSVFTQENERVMERFLNMTTDALHQPIEASWGMERPYGRQLFPQPDGHDGFYYACLSKAVLPVSESDQEESAEA
ncbi:16S rRNA (cytosine(967)-C(5))-methyltransferase RsmB [Nitrincola alkalilacustris]|uniref:16S rRNA (cytosine(967)-C(5))-methyltransferase RsmB n=1 Tax=Nitrincola alkalilacustris TaxID=1571224 RepID=UPI00124E3098|nr:16S rRNA (cytosine(967)-C(5))-methyltransferase RsmB [Nitrincola alkalilacustris]